MSPRAAAVPAPEPTSTRDAILDAAERCFADRGFAGVSMREIAADLLLAFHGTEARSGPGGWWILPEPELHFGDDVLVPDLAAWRCARMPIVPDAPAIAVAPDWLAEIISPSSIRHDRIVKMRRYAQEGVSWVWLVDPLARTLEVLRLEADRWTVVSSHAANEVGRPEPFAAVEIQLARWWLPR